MSTWYLTSSAPFRKLVAKSMHAGGHLSLVDPAGRNASGMSPKKRICRDYAALIQAVLQARRPGG